MGVYAYFNTAQINTPQSLGVLLIGEALVSLFFSLSGKALLYVTGARKFRKGGWAVVLKRKFGSRDIHPIDGLMR